jgi:hypothetical protein
MISYQIGSVRAVCLSIGGSYRGGGETAIRSRL